MTINHKIILSCLLAIVIIFGLEMKGMAGGIRSPFTIKIVLDKEEIALGEPLTGKVIITNIRPRRLRATFDVSLYIDHYYIYGNSTEIQTIYPGKTTFSLKTFRITEVSPRFHKTPGNWRITIKQPNVGDKYTAEAFYKIKSE